MIAPLGKGRHGQAALLPAMQAACWHGLMVEATVLILTIWPILRDFRKIP
jgi:hypothetical protein